MSTVTPGQVAAAGSIGFNYGPDTTFPMIYLTGAALTANGAAFPTLTFPGYNSLEIRLHLAGFSGSDTATLTFNGDTGNNYWDRNITIAAGGVTVTDSSSNTTRANIRVGAAGTTQIVAVLNIVNILAKSKLVVGRVAQATGAVGTAGTGYVFSGGEWVNTTAQITTANVQCLGANNLLSGSSIQIFGGL